MLNSSFAYQPRLSTTAPMPQPPTLQHFLSLGQNTTHQSVFCWTHGSRVETQQEHSPSPVSMNHPGWGFLLAQPAESFSLIHFLCSLSLYRTDFPGSKFPHNTRKPSRHLYVLYGCPLQQWEHPVPRTGPVSSYQVDDEPSLILCCQSWGQQQQGQEQAGRQHLGHGGLVCGCATGPAGVL